MSGIGPKKISREDAEAAFASSDWIAICRALRDITYFEEDRKWLQDTCLRFVDNSNDTIGDCAVTCLGHVARLHGHLDDHVVGTLKALRRDADRRGYAENALENYFFFAAGEREGEAGEIRDGAAVDLSEDAMLIRRAADYLRKKGIDFVSRTGRVCRRLPEGLIVAFLVPEALDSRCVVDPPDIRALVPWEGEVEVVRQY